MASQAQFTAKYCGECGTPISAKFCVVCGKPTLQAASSTTQGIKIEAAASGSTVPVASPSSDFEEVQDDIFGKDSLLRIGLQFVAAPVRTIIRLADDQSFHKQGQFMIACTTVVLSFFLFVLPRILSLPIEHARAQQVVLQINMYIGYFIMTPLQYYAARLLGGAPRRLKHYFKLCALSVGYTTLLMLPAAFFASAYTIASRNSAAYGFMFYLAYMIPAAIFVGWSHRIFWKLSWFRAIFLTVCLLIATLGLGLVLLKIETSTDLVGIIEDLL